jgi:hypothetical protein
MSLTLTKFDVAERQLNQAIRLFFDGGDPVSVHTLAEAAAQVLYDIRGELGATSKIRDADIIRTEFKTEWMRTVLSSRNFFKHADRDATAIHEFKEEFNHFSLLDAVNMYLSGKRVWTPETIVFVQWYAWTYPAHVQKGTDFALLVDRHRARHVGTAAEYIALCAQAIEQLRSSRVALPGVALSLGRQAG